jgi:hypothetical protein
MFTSSYSYSIVVWKYAENHYISNFSKCYGKARDITWDAIQQELYRLDKFLMTTKAEIISSCPEWDLIKCDFAIAWTRLSPHASWYRYIVFRQKKTAIVTILLVYGKNDVGKWQSETVWRKQIVKNNYEMVKKHFPTL